MSGGLGWVCQTLPPGHEGATEEGPSCYKDLELGQKGPSSDQGVVEEGEVVMGTGP